MYEYRIYVNSGSLWIRELCLVESGINVRAFHLPAGPIFIYTCSGATRLVFRFYKTLRDVFADWYLL